MLGGSLCFDGRAKIHFTVDTPYRSLKSIEGLWSQDYHSKADNEIAHKTTTFFAANLSQTPSLGRFVSLRWLSVCRQAAAADKSAPLAIIIITSTLSARRRV